MTEQPLHQLRVLLDAIDSDVHRLIMERSEISSEISRLKGGQGVFRPVREAEMLATRIVGHHGPLAIEDLAQIWTEMLSGSRAMQGPRTIGVLRDDATDARLALIRRCHGARIEILSLPDIDELIAALRGGEISLAALPLPRLAELAKSPGFAIVARWPFRLLEPDADPVYVVSADGVQPHSGSQWVESRSCIAVSGAVDRDYLTKATHLLDCQIVPAGACWLIELANDGTGEDDGAVCTKLDAALREAEGGAVFLGRYVEVSDRVLARREENIRKRALKKVDKF